jgi:hypothetical protein
MLRLLALSSEAAAERESNPYLDHGSLANLLRSRHLGPLGIPRCSGWCTTRLYVLSSRASRALA